jgi:hypothetical protein
MGWGWLAKLLKLGWKYKGEIASGVKVAKDLKKGDKS